MGGASVGNMMRPLTTGKRPSEVQDNSGIGSLDVESFESIHLISILGTSRTNIKIDDVRRTHRGPLRLKFSYLPKRTSRNTLILVHLYI